MANQFSTRQAFSQQAQKSINDTTLALDKNALAMVRAESATASFADATGKGRITLDNFGRTFDNATRKVLVWQTAILAVYGVMRKIGDMIQVWRDFEVTLARISITTGAVADKLQSYFKDVADIAIEFGVSIDETLTGMDLALRATASLGDSAKRTTTAVQLLRDASVLANITGMNYSQSIDILVGSLRQSGLTLNEGIVLLDKWTAVAKNAAVSVNDLSQGFAIMADAGRAAGLTVDQINGLIAALSETVTLGPTEVGNAIRALMSTLYNESSINLLQKFGVAVRDTQGEVRSFWEVMQQLSAMKTADVLDESVWLEIAKAAGAGQRRYAQFLALLNNFDQAMRVAGISIDAEGQAMDANDKIVNTLTNTWDKFTAAQRKFMFVMGEQTGIIEDLTGAMQGLTDFFDKLSGASEGVYKLGRAIMFLVGTLGALKVASLAMGWFGVGPKVGALMGRFGGVGAAQIAGTTAYARAVQAGGYPTAQAAQAAGLGTIAPMSATRLGALGLAGLLPGFARNRLYGNVASLSGLRWQGGAWRYAAGGPQGGQFAPTPTVGGVPFRPTTWGGIGRTLTRGTGFGMGAAVAGLATGAGVYGLTKDAIASAGAGLGSAFGLAMGGPIGMLAGTAIGTVAGKALSDAFVSEEDRIKAVFSGIAEDFGLNYEKLKETAVSTATELSEEARRSAAAAAAPEYYAQRKASEGFLGFFNIPAIKAPGEKEWTKGLGALHELNQAYVDGVISQEEYHKARQQEYIDWTVLSDSAKAYMSLIRAGVEDTGAARAEAMALSEALAEQAKRRRELTEVSNKYTESQARIREIMNETGTIVDGMNLKEWEQNEIYKLLGNQLKMTAEDYDAYYEALVGASYGYASHIEAIERLQGVASDLGYELNAIPIDKWLLIQKWDTDLATKITETSTSVAELSKNIEEFAINFADIAKLAGVEGTIADIDAVTEALKTLQEAAGDEELRAKYTQALTAIDEYLGQIEQRGIDMTKLAALTQVGAGFRPETQVRLVDADTIRAYNEQIGKLESLTTFAESLGKKEQSIITLVDPITQQTLRLEANTLALEMLGQVVDDNTQAIEKLEAEYNLPAGYQTPNRYWALRTLGTDYGGFGPAQEGLWGDWLEYLQQNRSYQGGGLVPETGPYYLHKRESVVSGDTLNNTNSILSSSYQVLVTSQQYLSNINLSLLGVRQEIQQLREAMATKGTDSTEGSTEFNRITRSNYVGVSTLGVRRR